MDIDYDIIKDFQTTSQLNQAVASMMIDEFQKPGLILLPLGKTFEEGIYPLVNEHFSYERINARDLINSQDTVISKSHSIHPELKLSHLDELIEGNVVFSETLRSTLPEPIKQCGNNFYPIDINNPEGFDRFIKSGSGPRVIFAGLGPDPGTAHIAFIGEDFINSSTAIVNLSQKAKESYNCQTAITIGTDIFRSAKLEKIIIVAKGEDKALSLRAGFQDPDTGLGYLIKHHKNKIQIFADHLVLQKHN
jgi:hypothetical protein